MALVYVGDATFVEKESIDLKEYAPREWSPRRENPKVYWYVQFPSLERLSYGLAMLKKGPKSKWLDHEEIGENRFFEPIAPLWDFSDALKELEVAAAKGKDRSHSFEEHPFVEVTKKDDYNKAFILFKGVENPEGMTAQERERIMRFELESESNWKGPGVYDLRDMTQHAKNVEKYEIESMEFYADQEIDGAHQGDWEPALHELIGRNI
jgi:hypothetical protein